MNRLSRSTALKTAAVISFLLSVWGFVDSLPSLARGAAAVNAAEGPPYSVIVLAFMFAIVKMVSAYGTWQQQRWGVVLTLLANALDTLTTVPGVFFAPTMYLWVGSIIGTILGIVVIVLCLWRDRKAAVA